MQNIDDPILLSNMKTFVEATKILGCMYDKALKSFEMYFEVDHTFAERFVLEHWVSTEKETLT